MKSQRCSKKLIEIADINKMTFDHKKCGDILYLDTSSVTRGVFDNLTVLKKGDKIPSRAKRGVKDKTIVYSTVRPNLQHFGILTKPPQNMVVSTGFATIDAKAEINANYLFYFLTQNRLIERLHTIATTNVSSYPSINPSDLENLIIDYSDLPTQRAIARVLSQLDEKIELNQKINTELENLARTIYIYNFVQNADSKWDRVKIVDLVGKTKTGDWGQETEQGNYTKAVTCIRGADINSVLNIEELKTPVRYILSKNSDKILSDGDFIVEISGGSPTQSTGRMTLITDSILNIFNKPLICSNFCKAFSLKDKSYFYWFYHLWTHLYDCGAFFGFESKTSGIKNFLFDRFVENYEIAVPDGLAIKAFNKHVTPFYDEIIKNRRESIELAALRDFLLPLLMNGQVTVEGIA